MRRVDTVAIGASSRFDVIDLFPVRDWPYEQFIGDAMGPESLSSQAINTIAIRVDGSIPQPA